MCGDVGDPIYCKEYLAIIRYIKEHNPKIHVYTITNGSYKTPSWWREFASISNQYDPINFSVDGYNQSSNNLYRVNSSFDSIMTGMGIMCRESSCYVNWAMIVFKFNEDHIDTMKDIARAQGCDGFQITKSTKFNSKYGNPEPDDLEPSEDNISSSNRYEREYINLRNRRLDNTEYMLYNQEKYEEVREEYGGFIMPMCLIGNRGLFVNAAGTLHPCSWVSYPYTKLSNKRKTIEYKNSFYAEYREQLNVIDRGLEDVLNDPAWDKLFRTFNDPDKAWVE